MAVATDRTKAQLRLVNASDAYAALDLRVDNQVRQGGVVYGAGADYAEVDTDKADSVIARSGSATALLSITPGVARQVLHGARLRRRRGAAAVADRRQRGRPRERAHRAARGQRRARRRRIGIYLTGADEPLASAVPVRAGAAFGVEGSLLTVDSATWRLRVTAAGSKTDLRLDLSALTLASQEVATLVLTPGRGGVLMNTLLLVQRGGIGRQDTALARVRVAAGVADSGAVSARVGDQVLMTSVGSPAVGLYTLLAAGTQPVVLAVNGNPLATAPVTLAAGADYTLLLHGAAAAPQAGWIEDDNRLSADVGSARLRLVNGVAALAVPLSMTADFLPVADGVAAGSASAYVSLAATTTAQLSVTAAGPGRAPVQRRRSAARRRRGVHGVRGRCAERRRRHPAQGPLTPGPTRLEAAASADVRRRPTTPIRSGQAAGLEVRHRLEDLLLRVHHERAVLGDGLVQRPAGDEEGARAGGVGAQHHAVGMRRIRQDRHALLRHRRAGDAQRAAIDIDEGVVAGRQRLLEGRARLQVQVKEERLGDLALHGACHAQRLAGDHAHAHARRRGFRNLVRRDVAIPGLAHLVARRQVAQRPTPPSSNRTCRFPASGSP